MSDYGHLEDSSLNNVPNLLSKRGNRNENEGGSGACRTKLILFTAIAFFIGGASGFILYNVFFMPTNDYKPNSSSNATFGCTLEADVKILLAKGFGTNPTFLDQQAKCGRDNLGNAGRTAACMEKTTGISKYCGECYGDLTHCGATNCRAECFLGPSERCTNCICKYCRVTFRKCTKLPCTLLPQSKWSCGDCPGHT